MNKNRFKLISLFSGAGGIDLGFELSNKFQLLLANDILHAPAKTYSYNLHHKIVSINEIFLRTKFPIYLLGDVSELDFGQFKPGYIDVVIGGPPCQDFSIVRGPEKERQGIAVKRGKLYAHFVRALMHIQPKIFVFENVPGLKSANKGIAYKVILEDFSDLHIKWKEIRNIVKNSFSNDVKNYKIIFSNIVDSADLGIPQRRKRLIVIGVREDLVKNDLMRLNYLINKSESILLGTNSLLRKYPLIPLEVFEGIPLLELADEYKNIMEEYENTAETVRTQKAWDWKNTAWKKLSFDAVKDYLMLNNINTKNYEEIEKAFEEHEKILKKLGYYKNRIEGMDFPDGSNKMPNESEEVLERLKMIPPDENHLFVKKTKWEVEGRGISLIYRRLHPLKPSYTVVARGGGGTWGYHYRRGRSMLTNRERARLQTFPDNFIFKGCISEVRAQIGEAVPPLLGEKIAEVADAILKDA